MTTPTSRLAYRPYYELLDRAMSAERGLRIRVGSIGQANQLRIRLHKARILDRDLARNTYPLEDPKFGVSIYDNLIVRTKGDDSWGEVIIEPTSLIGDIGSIEEISA